MSNTNEFDNIVKGVISGFHREISNPQLYSFLVDYFRLDKMTSYPSKLEVSVFSTFMLKAILAITFCYKSARGDQCMRFMIKYRIPMNGSLPDRLKRDVENMGREFQTYHFLEGISGIPKATTLEEILFSQGISEVEVQNLFNRENWGYLPNSIIIHYVEGDTLMNRLKGMSNNDKVKLIKEILSAVVDFQNAASSRASRLTSTSSDSKVSALNLFKERSMDTRITHYIQALVGNIDGENKAKVDDLSIRAVKAYKPVADYYYEEIRSDRPAICFGDLTTTNLILNDEKFFFVDPQLKTNDGLLDVACLLSSNGVNLTPKEWEEIAKEFRVVQAKKMGIVSSGWGKKLELNEDAKKNSLRLFYNFMLHFSLRNLAMATDYHRFLPEAFRWNTLEAIRELSYNVGNALDSLLTKDFGLTERDIRNYSDLRTILSEVGVGYGKPFKIEHIHNHTNPPLPDHERNDPLGFSETADTKELPGVEPSTVKPK